MSTSIFKTIQFLHVAVYKIFNKFLLTMYLIFFKFLNNIFLDIPWLQKVYYLEEKMCVKTFMET